MVLKNHFKFILIEFLCSFFKTTNQIYCAKFPFQREKATVEVTRLGIRVNTAVISMSNFSQVINFYEILSFFLIFNFYQIPIYNM